MPRDNPSNPFTSDEGHTKKEVAIPIRKATVMASENHPGEGGYHTVRIQVYGESGTYRAPVIAPMFGSAWVPKEGQSVVVAYGDGENPYVIGAWYPLDRVTDGDVDVPDYTAGDIRLGNDTGSHVTVKNGGSIDITTEGNKPVNIDHQSATVFMSSDQTVAGDGNYDIVQFDDVDNDPEGLYDAANYELIIRNTGSHSVEVTVEIDDAGQNNTYILALFKNESLMKEKALQSVVGQPLSLTCRTQRKLEAGDVIDTRLRQDSGSSKTIDSSDVATEFTVIRQGI